MHTPTPVADASTARAAAATGRASGTGHAARASRPRFSKVVGPTPSTCPTHPEDAPTRATGVYEEPRLTVGTYVAEWLAGREEHLSPPTLAGCARAVHYDLLPGFGPLRLLARHVQEWLTHQRAAGRGAVTLYRTTDTLRTALNAAVRTRRLAYNPAAYAVPARPASPERSCWTPEQAAAVLRHNATADASFWTAP